MQRPDGTPVQIYEGELGIFNLDDPLPSPAQQADSLILWIGDHQLLKHKNWKFLDRRFLLGLVPLSRRTFGMKG
jgi:hypothetical protein